MTAIKKISAKRVVKVLSALIMFCCLFFLTGVNFVVFPQFEKTTSSSSNIPGKQDNDPSAPVEEKSSSTNNLTVQEEYLHEKHSFKEIESLEAIIQHQVLAVEKLQVVHFELISPPPEV